MNLSHVFSRFNFFLYSRSLKCLLHIASYALGIGVSVMVLNSLAIHFNATFTFLLHVVEFYHICVLKIHFRGNNPYVY